MLFGAAARGVGCGVLGTAAMTVAEKAEQALTHRSSSCVPGRTLLMMLGAHPSDSERLLLSNHVMHWGTGAAIGALRGVWAVVGMRGVRADVAHTVVRLSFDQTLENVSGWGRRHRRGQCPNRCGTPLTWPSTHSSPGRWPIEWCQPGWCHRAVVSVIERSAARHRLT